MKIKSLLMLLFAFPSIGHADPSIVPQHAYEGYSGVRSTVFATHCLSCHSSDKAGPDRNGAPEDVNFDTYQATLHHAERAVARAVDEMTMPPASSGIPPLTEEQKSAMKGWQSEVFPLFPYISWGVFDGTRLTVPIIVVKGESTNYVATLKQILLKDSPSGFGYVLESAEPTSAEPISKEPTWSTADDPATFGREDKYGFVLQTWRLHIPEVETVQHDGDPVGHMVGGTSPFVLELIPNSNPMTFTANSHLVIPTASYSYKDTTLTLPYVKVGNERFKAALKMTPLESSPTGLGFVLESAESENWISDTGATFDTETGKVTLPYVEMVQNYKTLSIVRAELELVEDSDPMLFKLTSYTTIETTGP
jgi:hypothetical protein